MKRFPATLCGLASAVAFSYLNRDIKAILIGEVDDKISSFPQLKKFFISESKKEKFESTSCKISDLVVKMIKKKIKPSKEDLELFAVAVYLKSEALLGPNVTFKDAQVLTFCLKNGINLKDALSKIEDHPMIALDLMTKPVKVIHISTKISDVKKLIERSGLTGLPVVDENSYVVGMITKKDVERAFKSGIEDLSMVMSIPAISVKSDESIQKIGELMAMHDIGRIVVTDDQMKAIGIITRRDLVRAIASASKVYEVTSDISEKMKTIVPSKLLDLLKELGEFANAKNKKIYAVGGFVRDLLMNEKSLDVDVVVEGDGIEMAREFAAIKNVKVLTYPEFGTAKILLNGNSIDVATARTEYYEVPGALPKIESSNLKKDLYRRDFTMNAMAIDLVPPKFGTLLDFFGGREDIKNRTIRVLHSMSFIEDPTRMLRAVRYAAKFDYKLSEQTQKLFNNALKNGYLNSVSSSRIRAEFERSLEDEKAEEIFDLFQRYGIFKTLYCDTAIDFKRFFRILKSIDHCRIKKFYAIFILILKNCSLTRAIEIMKFYGLPKKFLEAFAKIKDETFLSLLENVKTPFDLHQLLSKLPEELLSVLAYENTFENNVLQYVRTISKVKLEKINGSLLTAKYGIKGIEIKKVLDEILKAKIDEGLDEMEALDRIISEKK
jgi:tRNA nucleotidyltransferase (CCA-adding enzyme)|uniref:CBS domain-containing protein n=1 Tax=Mesoaciditoga lauensis TaxID=1495039 RepID=A0A7V3RFF4_9BACT